MAKLQSNSLQDKLSGQQLKLSFDAENRDGIIKDANGNVLPSINTFWFAWYAFHPDTKIFKADKE